MLAMIDACRDEYEFVAIGPEQGMLAEELAARDLQLIPLSLRDDDNRRLPREVVCERLRLAIGKSAANLVHANSLSMGRLTGAIAADLSVPCLAHLRDIIGLSAAAVADLNRNSLLIAVSQATADFHRRQGMSAEKLKTIYNGVDTECFQPRTATGELKRQLGLPAKATLVGTIGQIGARKGQDLLASAAGRIDAVGDLHYLLIGERNSTKQETIEFEQNLTRRFPPGRLHRLGYRSDVEWLLGEIDLLVHPARQEPFGRVLLEAAAAGVPIIATNVGGTVELLQHGESALLVPPDDPQVLATAIVALVDDEARRIALGTAARRRMEDRFTIADAATKLKEAWESLLG